MSLFKRRNTDPVASDCKNVFAPLVNNGFDLEDRFYGVERTISFKKDMTEFSLTWIPQQYMPSVYFKGPHGTELFKQFERRKAEFRDLRISPTSDELSITRIEFLELILDTVGMVISQKENELITLGQKWIHLASKYTSNEAKVAELWHELSTNYSGPNRHYHTLHHLVNMMQWVDQLEKEIDDIDTMCFSIFYHDVIYDASRNDNEEKSAEFAAERLESIGLSSDQIEKCAQQIVSTKAHDVSTDQDTNILIDIDLSILGTDRTNYEWYSKAIRKEYSIYSDEIYIPGRMAVLRHFLQKPVIFSMPFLASRLEEQAQRNLETELNTLIG